MSRMKFRIYLMQWSSRPFVCFCSHRVKRHQYHFYITIKFIFSWLFDQIFYGTIIKYPGLGLIKGRWNITFTHINFIIHIISPCVFDYEMKNEVLTKKKKKEASFNVIIKERIIKGNSRKNIHERVSNVVVNVTQTRKRLRSIVHWSLFSGKVDDNKLLHDPPSFSVIKLIKYIFPRNYGIVNLVGVEVLVVVLNEQPSTSQKGRANCERKIYYTLQNCDT